MRTMRLSLALAAAVGIALLASCAGSSSQCTSCTGCCNAQGRCESGSSNKACGSGGLACSECGLSQTCSVGRCVVTVGNTGGGSSGTGGGFVSGGGSAGGGSATGYVLMQGPLGNQVVSLASGDPCAGAALLLAEANTLIGQCTDLLNQSPPLPPFTETACRQRLPDCNQSDRQFGDQYLNCLRRLEPCTAANRGSIENRHQVCVNSYAAAIRRECVLSLRY